jgi:WD40 repeat protein
MGVAFSPDGKVLATTGNLGDGSDVGEVKLWDAPIAKERANLVGHRGKAPSLAFAADGKTLVTAGGAGDGPGELKVWDVSTGELKREVAGPPRRAEALGIAPDGKWIVSVGHGGVDGRAGEVTLRDLAAIEAANSED